MPLQSVTVTHYPNRIFLERGIFQQSVNFEFQFKTDSNETIELQEISVDGFDEKDNFLFRLPLNNFGIAPAISIIPQRRIDHDKTLEIFNPLSNFPLDYPIHRLLYQFTFRTQKNEEAKSEISIYPVVYNQSTTLILPLTGNCLVTEGHDSLTHHARNFPFTHPLIQQIGITGNSSRFAYDFVLLDEELRMFKAPPRVNEDYYGWDKSVLCPGEGEITGLANDSIDNQFGTLPEFDVQAHIKEPEVSMAKHFGNYLMIDHGKNEFSVLAHLRRGSIKAKLGDIVSKGDLLGRIGTSGDSFFPHLHYQVQQGKSFLKSEGLPSIFESFDLLMGCRKKTVEKSYPNTGMVIAQEVKFKKSSLL
jgi:Peptidase family M23